MWLPPLKACRAARAAVIGVPQLSLAEPRPWWVWAEHSCPCLPVDVVVAVGLCWEPGVSSRCVGAFRLCHKAGQRPAPQPGAIMSHARGGSLRALADGQRRKRRPPACRAAPCGRVRAGDAHCGVPGGNADDGGRTAAHWPGARLLQGVGRGGGYELRVLSTSVCAKRMRGMGGVVRINIC